LARQNGRREVNLCSKTLRDTGASYLKTRREQAMQRAEVSRFLT